jgi:hypothetical protein
VDGGTILEDRTIDKMRQKHGSQKSISECKINKRPLFMLPLERAGISCCVSSGQRAKLNWRTTTTTTTTKTMLYCISIGQRTKFNWCVAAAAAATTTANLRLLLLLFSGSPY